MHRFFEPSAAGSILFVFFLAFQALCGDTTTTSIPGRYAGDATTTLTLTTFGAPTVLETRKRDHGAAPARTAVAINWPVFAAVLIVGWSAAMTLGRLMLDGGVRSRAARTLLPPRRHPALWLLAYLAAVPLLALPGALIDLLHNGVRGLASPDGPSAYPLLVLVLIFFGLPVVAIFLAVRRVLDRRSAARPFETDAPPKPQIEWPFA
jgi:hypothetical protein